MTYSESALPVSGPTFDEIDRKLVAAGYAGAGEKRWISMTGLRITTDDEIVREAMRDATGIGGKPAMNPRQSSDEVASLASRILAAGDPFENEQVRRAILRELAGVEDGTVTPEAAFAELRHVFFPYFQNMKTLAGSVVSQARPG